MSDDNATDVYNIPTILDKRYEKFRNPELETTTKIGAHLYGCETKEFLMENPDSPLVRFLTFLHNIKHGRNYRFPYYVPRKKKEEKVLTETK